MKKKKKYVRFVSIQFISYDLIRFCHPSIKVPMVLLLLFVTRSNLLGVQDPEALGGHTVNAPFGISMVIADSYGEAPVVGPNQVDQLSFSTFDFQHFAFTGVRCIVPRRI